MKSLSQIAAELQGYDPQALPVGQVHEFLAQLALPVMQVEAVALPDALGRVLAQEIISPISVPPHDNSAMDGFAFAGLQLGNNDSLSLKVMGTALAGKAWQGRVEAGQCVKIMTGAIMPAEMDTVVPQELCRVEALADGGQIIHVAPGTLKLGDNRRFAGEDLQAGQAALSKGELLAPASLGLLASLNIASVPVFRKLKVAYFSTGDEVLSLGDAPREGAIYDANRYTVQGLLRKWGMEVIDMGVVRDDPAVLEEAFLQAAATADAIITSGGVSVGEADFTKAMMKKLGDVAFWKIAMRPGRPMAVGRLPRTSSSKKTSFEEKSASIPYKISAERSVFDSTQNSTLPHNDCILFGLPGNPVATMVTMLAFVRPALMRMSGAAQKHCEPPLLLQAKSSEVMRKRPGRTEYQRGFVSRASNGDLQVRTTSANQGSGVLSSMVAANGLIVLHHDQGNVNVGDVLDVMMFEGVM